MARVTRLVFILAWGIGSALAVPNESHAGIIPWMYDAIFGPVGSMRANSANYAPYSAGYAPYSAGYAPYSAGYAPYYASYSAYAPVTTADYASGCSTCNSCSQASYVPSSECSTCGSGNCSTGTCSNCTVNSAPTGGYAPSNGLGPVPDSSNRSRDAEIRRLELKLEELDHREKQTEKFLRRQHTDYVPEQFRPSTYVEEEEGPARKKKDTFDSDSANPDNFKTPTIHHGRGAPSNPPTEENSQKPIIPPKDDSEKKNEGASRVKEVEPQTLRLENRITTRAVAPRERLQIVTKQAKTSVAKTSKANVKTSETTRPEELARK